MEIIQQIRLSNWNLYLQWRCGNKRRYLQKICEYLTIGKNWRKISPYDFYAV